jgi:hypothetical protein
MAHASKHPFKTPEMQLNGLSKILRLPGPSRYSFLEQEIRKLCDSIVAEIKSPGLQKATKERFGHMPQWKAKEKERDELFLLLARYCSEWPHGIKSRAYTHAVSLFLDNSRRCRRLGIL